MDEINYNPFSIWTSNIKEGFKVRESFALLHNRGRSGSKRDSTWLSSLLEHPFLSHQVSMTEIKNVEMTEKQVKTLATLVPDTMLHNIYLKQKEIEQFVGVLLLADVSGFTSLCQQYEGMGRTGTYRLTATLNTYLGAIVEIIYKYKGDVIKFSGDAVLAVWKVRHDQFMFTVIHDVIACALLIQERIKTYQTNVNVELKAKLAISAGDVTFCILGTEKARHYIMVGIPIKEVKIAETLCHSGEVIVSPSAWDHCGPRNYHHTLCDSSHVKVDRILYDPASYKLEIFQFPQFTDPWMSRQKVPIRSYQSEEIIRLVRNEILNGNLNNYTLRPSLFDRADNNVAAKLRPFMIPPVIQQIDSDQPLEYLTEMRQVTTMFINVVPQDLQTKELIRLVDEVYSKVTNLVYQALGCVIQVSLFDKDLMVLAVFGLRGFKNEQETRSGLRCGLNARHAVTQIRGIRAVSVGITTGMAYCGVVGHPMRREYTVIGAAVNKAARLMCAYPNKVTCEKATRLKSNLPSRYFVLQNNCFLKGIGNVGYIFEYTEESIKTSSQTTQDSVQRPLLGRDHLMEELVRLIHDVTIGKSENIAQAVILQGETGIGKSRVLRELSSIAKYKGLNTNFFSLQSKHTSPFASIQYMCQQFFGSSSTEREQCLRIALRTFPKEDLCCLNRIFDVNFPCKEILNEITTDQLKEQIASMILFIFKDSYPFLLLIDDLHFMDDESWLICEGMLRLQEADKLSPFLVVASLCPQVDLLPQSAKLVLSNPRVAIRILPGLSPSVLAPLACQLISVEAIQAEIVQILESNSGGNPGWCANYLLPLLGSGNLNVEIMTRSEAAVRGFLIPDKALVQPKSSVSRSSNSNENSELSIDSVFSYSSVGYIYDDEITSEYHKSIESGILTRESTETNGSDNSLKISKSTESDHKQCRDIACQVSSYNSNNSSTHGTSLGQDESKTIKVCILTSRYDYDKKAAIHINGIIVSSFDRLPPYEQLILKCSSALTGPFHRDMLLFILQSVRKISFSQTAAAIKRLFDMCILECGTEVQNQCFAKEGTVNIGVGTHVDCTCTFLPSELQAYEGENLPRYAFCKLLTFQNPAFQRAIYDLLPSNQKRNFHIQAVIFLEQLPLVCRSCVTPDKTVDTNYCPQNFTDCSSQATIKSLEFLIPNIDYKKCVCLQLKADVFKLLVYHCFAAGLQNKQIRFMIEYGSVAIITFKLQDANRILTEALNLTQKSLKEKQTTEAMLHLGRILIMLGQIHLLSEKMEDSKLFLTEALKALHLRWLRYLACSSYTLYMVERLQFLVLKSPLKLSEIQCAEYLERSFCLALLSDMYLVNREYLWSRVAALTSLYCALCTGKTGIMQVCKAFICVIESSIRNGNLRFCAQIENYAIQSFQECARVSINSIQHMCTHARFLGALCFGRFNRGSLKHAMEAGMVALHLIKNLKAWKALITILPIMTHTLLLKGHSDEALDLLHTLKETSNEFLNDEIMLTKLMVDYHAIQLDIVLHSDSQKISFAQKILIVQEASNYVNHHEDKNNCTKRAIMINLWLWYIRNEDWDSAAVWKRSIENNLSTIFMSPPPEYVSWTLLNLLEAVLITHAASQDYCNNLRIPLLLQRLKMSVKYAPVILPRFLHLQAYWIMIQGGCFKIPLAMHKLKTAYVLAHLHGNKTDEAWCIHSKKVWKESEVNEECVEDNHSPFFTFRFCALTRLNARTTP